MSVGTRHAQAEGLPPLEASTTREPVAWLSRGVLRTALVVLPSLCVFLFEIYREAVPSVLSDLPGSLMLTALVCLGAIASTRFLFALLEQRRRSLLWLARELSGLAAVPAVGSFRTDEVLGKYLDRLLRALPADAAAIYLSEVETGRCVRSSALGAVSAALPPELDLHAPDLAEAIRTGEVCWRPEQLRLGGVGQVLPAALIPLRSRDLPFGVLVLIGDGRGLLREQLDVLAVLGSQIAVILDNYSLFQETRELSEQREHLAVLQERDRLAREMHDSLAQVLGLIALKARVVQDVLADGDIPRALSEVADVEATADAAYADVREAILGLRGAIKAERRLVPTLKEYLTQFGRQNHLRVDLDVVSDAPTSFVATAETQLIRVIQEALTNVRKHARASSVRVGFAAEPGYGRIVVEDDGVGFVPSLLPLSGSGYGLQTMAERVESLGGTLTIDSKPGRGTRVIVLLPVEMAETDAPAELSAPAVVAGCQAE